MTNTLKQNIQELTDKYLNDLYKLDNSYCERVKPIIMDVLNNHEVKGDSNSFCDRVKPIIMDVLNNHEVKGDSNSFCVQLDVPYNLADYIEVERGSKLSRLQITSKIWFQLRKRKLVYELDRRVFRVDEETSELFGIHVSVNKSINFKDQDGFNFCTLPVYITNVLKPKKRKHSLIDDISEQDCKYRKYDHAEDEDEYEDDSY